MMPPYQDAITSSPDLADFGYRGILFTPFDFIAPKTLNYLVSYSFDFEHTL